MYQSFHLVLEDFCNGFGEIQDLPFLGCGFIHTMNQGFDLRSETHDDYDDDYDDDDDMMMMAMMMMMVTSRALIY